MNILLALVLIVNIATLTFFVVSSLYLKRTIKNFVTAPDKDTPSPFALLVDSMAVLVARAVVTNVKAGVMGVLSGESRRETSSMIQNNPLLGLAGMFLGKKNMANLARNPAILDWAMSRLNKSGQAGVNPPNSSQSPDTGQSGMDIKI